MVRSISGLERGGLAAKCGVVHLVKHGAEKCDSFFVVVGFNLVLNANDETGGYCGEETGLCTSNVSSRR